MAATALDGGAVAVRDPGAASIELQPHQPPAPPAEAFDERLVVAAVLGGDRDAFRALVEREAGSVVRACQRILGDRHEAEDVAQEAFVMAYRSLATWRGEGPFGAWLSRIAVRLALRQAAKRRTVAWIDPVGGASPTDVAVSIPADPGQVDPSIIAIRAERSAGIRDAVARLDEPYRETVALRFFAERSLNEIAEATGRPLGTVKTHLHRGLQRLRAELAAGGVDR
jgi:RNA polymerase sigma-70 factor (ECF subfamily)